MRSLILISIILVGLSSCNKEKKAFKNISGSWFVELLFVDDQEQTGLISSFTFSDCDYANEEFCDLEIALGNGVNLEYNYRIKHDFNHIIIQSKLATSPTIFKYDIIEFSRKKLTIEYSSPSNGTFLYYLTKG